jgi:hypothetical protein
LESLEQYQQSQYQQFAMAQGASEGEAATIMNSTNPSSANQNIGYNGMPSVVQGMLESQARLDPVLIDPNPKSTKNRDTNVNLGLEALQIFDSVRIGLTTELGFDFPGYLSFKINVDAGSVGGDFETSTVERGVSASFSLGGFKLADLGIKQSIEQRGGQTVFDLPGTDWEKTETTLSTSDIIFSPPIPGVAVDLNLNQAADFIVKGITYYIDAITKKGDE